MKISDEYKKPEITFVDMQSAHGIAAKCWGVGSSERFIFKGTEGEVVFYLASNGCGNFDPVRSSANFNPQGIDEDKAWAEMLEALSDKHQNTQDTGLGWELVSPVS